MTVYMGNEQLEPCQIEVPTFNTEGEGSKMQCCHCFHCDLEETCGGWRGHIVLTRSAVQEIHIHINYVT